MKLVANNLYRSSRPKSCAELKLFGITTVINLQTGGYELFHDDQYEKDDPEDFGIHEHHIKCSAIFAPSFKQVKQMVEIVQKAPGPVLIHCKRGKDRTGFMCAAYRILVCQWSADYAIHEMLEGGFRKAFYWFWIPRLRHLAEMELRDL